MAKIKDILDMNNPIAKAVMPLKQDAMDSAKQEAEATVSKVIIELEKADWDKNAVAPYPKSNMGRNEYLKLVAKYNLFSLLTETDYVRNPHSRRMNEANHVKISQEYVDKFVKQSVEQAAFDYDAFVIKLTKKIGLVESAELKGNHIWGESYLTVWDLLGNKSVWKTLQIINTSKLGRLFYQWPTRRLKGI